MITISVSGRRATASNLVSLPTGNVQSIKVQFVFPLDDPLWQNALIVAVFAAKTPKGAWIVRPGVIDEDMQATIPGDVLRVAESEVYVGVRATYADNREVTTNVAGLGKTVMGAGGEIVDNLISNSELTGATDFLSDLYELVLSQLPNAEIDDVQLLQFRTYDNLLIRDGAIPGESIQDVPVYVQGGQGTICKLYNYTPGQEYDHVEPYDMIALKDIRDPVTGLPCFVISVMMGGVYASYFPTACYGTWGLMQPGWYRNDQPCDPPQFNGFAPNRFVVVNNGQRTEYDDLSTLLPADARSALHSLSQCINVSAEALGTVFTPEKKTMRFAGKIRKNHKYAFKTGDRFALTLPVLPWSEEDEQFVLYLHCTSNIDVSFPQGSLFVEGIPNTLQGQHKIVGCKHAGAAAWMISGLDYE